jgi:hypothetical protein
MPTIAHTYNGCWFNPPAISRLYPTHLCTQMPAIGGAQVVYDSYTSKGMMSTYCDYAIGEQYMWKAGMGRLGFLFYLSKYYEFLDTAILIVKQKKVSLLQSYHHAGAVRVLSHNPSPFLTTLVPISQPWPLSHDLGPYLTTLAPISRPWPLSHNPSPFLTTLTPISQPWSLSHNPSPFLWPLS